MFKNVSLLLASLSFYFTLPCISLAAPIGIVIVDGSKPSRVVYAAECLNVYDYSSSLNALMSAQSDADFKELQKEQKQVEMRVIAVYEKKVFNDQLDRKLAEAKKQAANYEALASTELGHIKAEQMFKKEITKNSKKHGTQLNWTLVKTQKVTDGTTFTCELNIELRQGGSKVDFRVVDYQRFATNSGCRDLS